MILLAPLLLFAATQAIPPPPPPPEMIHAPYYSCMVEREAPGGTVSAFKLIQRSGQGVNEERLHTWVTDLAPGGVQIQATWGDDPPAQSGAIVILYAMAESPDVYRIRIVGDPQQDANGLQWETPLRHPSQGSLQTSAPWGPFMGLLAHAPDPRVVILGADGTVLRSDPVDLLAFARAVMIGDSLEPELDAMVADYRHRCELIEERPT